MTARNPVFGAMLLLPWALLACGSEGGDAPASGGSPNLGGAGGQVQASGGSGGAIANSGGSSSLTLIEPIERDGKLVLEFGSTFFQVDPEIGGRVTSLRLDDAELLTGPEVNDVNFGSTFWTSPQADWENGWPPPPAIDNQPYEPSVNETSSSLSLLGSTAEFSDKSWSVDKTFTADLVREAITLVYRVHNTGTESRSVAPWEVSRVEAGGLTFFPSGDSASTPEGSATLPVTSSLGVTWFDSEAHPPDGESKKLNADGKQGWLAHVSGDILFLKLFDDVPAAELAPGEGEVEIFVSSEDAGSYIELENQGAYDELAPGALSSYRVTWLLRRVPSNVVVEAGSQSLLDFVDSLL